MLVLCGFTLSNYHNKVKLALLEKGVPFIRTPHGTLCESQAVLEYIEQAHPTPPRVPADAWQAAKVRELVTFIELHIELVARELYPKTFFGGGPADRGDGDEDQLRRRPADPRRHRLEDLRQASR